MNHPDDIFCPRITKTQQHHGLKKKTAQIRAQKTQIINNYKNLNPETKVELSDYPDFKFKSSNKKTPSQLTKIIERQTKTKKKIRNYI